MATKKATPTAAPKKASQSKKPAPRPRAPTPAKGKATLPESPIAKAKALIEGKSPQKTAEKTPIGRKKPTAGARATPITAARRTPIPSARRTPVPSSRRTPVPKEKATWQLRLYVAGDSPRSRTALSNLRKLCEERLKDDYEIHVIDLTKLPHLAKADQIIAVPTLVRSIPEPMKRIIGDLSNADRALLALDLDTISPRIP